MKTSSRWGIAVATLLIVAGLFLAYIRGLQPPPPETLIRQSLKDVEESAKRHNPRGVMEVVSDSFQAGPLNKRMLNLQLIRAMQNGRGTDYDVHVNEPKILPATDPDKRIVITQASVFFSGSGDDIWSANPMTLVMRKESRRKWLFFHEPRWRIIGVANMPPLPGSGDDEDAGAGIADVFGK